MNTRTLLTLVIASAACSYAAPGELETADKFTNRLVTTAGLPAERPACAPMPFDLGATWKVSIPDRQLELTLPTSYQREPQRTMEETTGRTWDSNFPSKRGLNEARQWSPGLHVPPAWDRFIRFRTQSNRIDALFQVDIGKGYPFFVTEPPWKLAISAECMLAIAKRPVRVLLFELSHPVFPPQWGIVAFWRDLGEGWNPTHYLSAFALGPDQAFQAEALQILRRQGPH